MVFSTKTDFVQAIPAVYCFHYGGFSIDKNNCPNHIIANIKEVHYRRPQLDTFYIVIWQQKSIIQLYKAVIRHYRIFQSLHNFPPRTFPPKNLATRVNTMENINLIVYYKQSSKNKPFEVSNQFLKPQASAIMKVVSCHITPPGGPGRPK